MAVVLRLHLVVLTKRQTRQAVHCLEDNICNTNVNSRHKPTELSKNQTGYVNEMLRGTQQDSSIAELSLFHN
jgi:hypothetical protein